MTEKKVMKKKVKKWGDTLVISFNKEDCELWGIVEGTIINLEDMIVENVIKHIGDGDDNDIDELEEEKDMDPLDKATADLL